MAVLHVVKRTASFGCSTVVQATATRDKYLDADPSNAPSLLHSHCSSKPQIRSRSSRNPISRPFLPPSPQRPSSLHKRFGCARAAAAAAPVPPGHPKVVGGFDSLNNWLLKSHSTEITRFLEARGIILPDFLAWLPPGIHQRLHYAEDELGIIAQELLLAVMVLVFLSKRKRLLGFLHDKWYNVVRKGEKDVYTEHKRSTFEHTVFGALEGPVAAATSLLWASHVYTVVAPLLDVKFAAKAISGYREVSIIGVLTWFLLNWKNNIIGELKARSSNQSTKAQLGALDKLATVLIVSFGVMVTGEVAGYAFKSILALGGVSGIAVGLAARDVIGNMFGGTMLYLTRPFAIGDTIKAGNVNGQVVDIGFYSTKVLSPEKQPTYVPNAYFTNQVITNFSRAKNRVLNGVFTLRHQDLVKVDHIVDQIRNFVAAHQAIDLQSSINVNLVNVTPYNLEIQVNAVTKAGLGGNEFNRAKHDIFIRVVSIIDQCGARLSAYPDQPFPPIPSAS